MLSMMQCGAGRVPAQKALEWLTSFPELGNVVTMTWDDMDSQDLDDDPIVEVLDEAGLRRHIEYLASQVVAEQQAAFLSTKSLEQPAGQDSLQSSESDPIAIKTIKAFLRTQVQ